MKTTRIMNKIIIYLSAVLLLCSCGSARNYAAFQYDNGDDYVSEGLYRIVDRKGRIGYADETGKTVIRPRFAFGYPFEGGKAKVTDSGERKEVAGSGSEHWYWESDDWYYIDKQGNRCENQDTDKDKTVIVKTCSDIFYTIGQKKSPMPSAKIRNYSHSHNLMSQ